MWSRLRARPCRRESWRLLRVGSVPLQPARAFGHYAGATGETRMRLGGEGPSGNFEDRTGGGGFGGFGGGGGGNMLGCLLPFVLSRFGIGGVLILLLGYCALTQLGGGGGLIPGGAPTSSSAPSGGSTLDPQMEDFLRRVLGSTEETW